MTWRHWPAVVAVAALAGIAGSAPIVGTSPYAVAHASRAVHVALLAVPFGVLFVCALVFGWWSLPASVAYMPIVVGMKAYSVMSELWSYPDRPIEALRCGLGCVLLFALPFGLVFLSGRKLRSMIVERSDGRAKRGRTVARMTSD